MEDWRKREKCTANREEEARHAYLNMHSVDFSAPFSLPRPIVNTHLKRQKQASVNQQQECYALPTFAADALKNTVGFRAELVGDDFETRDSDNSSPESVKLFFPDLSPIKEEVEAESEKLPQHAGPPTKESTKMGGPGPRPGLVKGLQYRTPQDQSPINWNDTDSDISPPSLLEIAKSSNSPHSKSFPGPTNDDYADLFARYNPRPTIEPIKSSYSDPMFSKRFTTIHEKIMARKLANRPLINSSRVREANRNSEPVEEEQQQFKARKNLNSKLDDVQVEDKCEVPDSSGKALQPSDKETKKEGPLSKPLDAVSQATSDAQQRSSSYRPYSCVVADSAKATPDQGESTKNSSDVHQLTASSRVRGGAKGKARGRATTVVNRKDNKQFKHENQRPGFGGSNEGRGGITKGSKFGGVQSRCENRNSRGGFATNDSTRYQYRPLLKSPQSPLASSKCELLKKADGKADAGRSPAGSSRPLQDTASANAEQPAQARKRMSSFAKSMVMSWLLDVEEEMVKAGAEVTPGGCLDSRTSTGDQSRPTIKADAGKGKQNSEASSRMAARFPSVVDSEGWQEVESRRKTRKQRNNSTRVFVNTERYSKN